MRRTGNRKPDFEFLEPRLLMSNSPLAAWGQAMGVGRPDQGVCGGAADTVMGLARGILGEAAGLVAKGGLAAVLGNAASEFSHMGPVARQIANAWQGARRWDDCGDTLRDAAKVRLDADTGSRSVAGEIDFAGDVDMRSMVAVQTGVMTIALDTPGRKNALRAKLVVYDASGRMVASAAGSGSSDPTVRFDAVAGRKYYFLVTGLGGSAGKYQARISTAAAPVNHAPVASDDAYVMDEDGVLALAAPAGVLANDRDADGNALAAALVQGPANGALSLGADGSFVYTPNANWNGVDTFTYKASDGKADSALATVRITVNPVNDAPVAADDAFALDEDSALTMPVSALLANDSDADGDSLAAALVDGPANGTLAFNPDGTFTYTPKANFNGVDTFTYKASDGKADSGLATVRLTVNPVNDAPAAQDDAYAMDGNNTLTVAAPAGVLANDSDVDGNALAAVLVDGPKNGVLEMQADGSFVYTPALGFSGADTFTYMVNDGTVNSGAATVTVTVRPVSDPLAKDDAYTVAQNGTLSVTASAGFLANDTDSHGDMLIGMVLDYTTNGRLSPDPFGGFTYTPNRGFSGVDVFTYMANDGMNFSNVATVTINVVAV
jgi:VCBS repeat-containing protein